MLHEPTQRQQQNLKGLKSENEFVMLKKQPTKLHNRTRPARTVCTVLPVTAHLDVNTLLFFLHIFFRRWRWTFWRSMNRIRSWSNTAACQQTLTSLTCLSSSPQNSVIALQYGMIRVPVPVHTSAETCAMYRPNAIRMSVQLSHRHTR